MYFRRADPEIWSLKLDVCLSSTRTPFAVVLDGILHLRKGLPATEFTGVDKQYVALKLPDPIVRADGRASVGECAPVFPTSALLPYLLLLPSTSTFPPHLSLLKQVQKHKIFRVLALCTCFYIRLSYAS